MGSSAVDLHTASSTPARAEIPAGAACLDTSGNPRIPLLMQLVGDLSRAVEPNEVLSVFASGLLKLHGPRGYVSLSTRGLQPGEYRITRMLREADPVSMIASDTWSQADVLPVHRGGIFGGIIRSAYPEVIHHLELVDDPVVGDWLSDYGSLMAIPLFDEGEPRYWAITLRREPEGFTVDELEEAILRSNLVGGTVKNTVLTRQLRDANARIQREIEQIGRIQRALLPKHLPEIPGLSIGANFETFDTAGGDMYDFERITVDGLADDERPWAFLVADAAGHGPAAATVIAMLNAILYAAPRDALAIHELMEFANRHLYAKGLEGTFVTAILGSYDPRTRDLTYARAGHPPALLMQAGNGSAARIERLDEVGGLPLGVMGDVLYESHTVRLEPGHTIVLYTDGITESASPTGEQFGVEGIERSLTECTGFPECVIGHITAALKAHEGGQRPNDDQTIVTMKVL